MLISTGYPMHMESEDNIIIILLNTMSCLRGSSEKLQSIMPSESVLSDGRLTMKLIVSVMFFIPKVTQLPFESF